MKQLILLFTSFLLSVQTFAQEKAPLLSGKVKISIQEGTFECDLTLSDIPSISNYFIRLNAGMNVLHFRSKAPNDFLIYWDKSLHDTTSTGESSAYFFPAGNGKFLPVAVQLKYVGKFPVIRDTIENYSKSDWKGNIAFNHYAVRADGFQSCWYPVLYDIDHDKLYDKVRTNIEIVCEDCNALYVNGNIPVKSAKAVFRNETPQELSLFCGNYDFTSVGNTYVLNPDINEGQIKEFCGLINSYKKFYADKLKLAFEQPVTLVQTTPTSAENAWLFVSYPTIFNIGWGKYGLISLFDPAYQEWFKPFIAHELGHCYFGGQKSFNSELGDMMSEGFAEYLSLQLTRELIGKKTYEANVQTKIDGLAGLTPKPFAKIRSKPDYDNRGLYVYYYAPLIFLAVEKEIGEKMMWKWLHMVLETPAPLTNYEFLAATLKSALQNDKQFEQIKSQYFENDQALENAIARIGKK